MGLFFAIDQSVFRYLLYYDDAPSKLPYHVISSSLNNKYVHTHTHLEFYSIYYLCIYSSHQAHICLHGKENMYTVIVIVYPFSKWVMLALVEKTSYFRDRSLCDKAKIVALECFAQWKSHKIVEQCGTKGFVLQIGFIWWKNDSVSRSVRKNHE